GETPPSAPASAEKRETRTPYTTAAGTLASRWKRWYQGKRWEANSQCIWRCLLREEKGRRYRHAHLVGSDDSAIGQERARCLRDGSLRRPWPPRHAPLRRRKGRHGSHLRTSVWKGSPPHQCRPQIPEPSQVRRGDRAPSQARRGDRAPSQVRRGDRPPPRLLKLRRTPSTTHPNSSLSSSPVRYILVLLSFNRFLLLSLYPSLALNLALANKPFIKVL
ncbi:hypothetical protein DFP72DRAFT_1132696, partial [Ephemerocybe angulata]